MGSVVDIFDGGGYDWARLGADVAGAAAVAGGTLLAVGSLGLATPIAATLIGAGLGELGGSLADSLDGNGKTDWDKIAIGTEIGLTVGLGVATATMLLPEVASAVATVIAPSAVATQVAADVLGGSSLVSSTALSSAISTTTIAAVSAISAGISATTAVGVMTLKGLDDTSKATTTTKLTADTQAVLDALTKKEGVKGTETPVLKADGTPELNPDGTPKTEIVGGSGDALLLQQQEAAQKLAKANSKFQYDKNMEYLAEKEGTAVIAENQKFKSTVKGSDGTIISSGDTETLNTLMDVIKSPTKTFEEKQAAIETAIATGVGTESMKSINQARQIVLDQNDMTAEDGMVNLKRKQLANQLYSSRLDVINTINARNVGEGKASNANNAIGVTGEMVDRFITSGNMTYNRAIEGSMKANGYDINAASNGVGGFDAAVNTSLAGTNLNQQTFDNQVQRNAQSVATGLSNLQTGVTELENNDANWWSSFETQKKEIRTNAEIALSNSDASYNVQDAQLASEKLQFNVNAYKLDTQFDQLALDKINVDKNNSWLGYLTAGFNGANTGLKLASNWMS